MSRKEDKRQGGKGKEEAGWDIISYPHLTEKSVELVDKQNTLVFIVEKRSTKEKIKKAVENLFEVKVEEVNTQINAKGRKKAYIKLKEGYEALDVATRLGML